MIMIFALKTNEYDLKLIVFLLDWSGFFYSRQTMPHLNKWMKKFKKKKQLVKTPNFKLSTVYERTIKLCYFWLLPKMFLIGRTSWKHSYLARQSNDNCNLPKIAIIIIPNYPLTVLSLHLTRKLMMDRNMLED